MGNAGLTERSCATIKPSGRVVRTRRVAYLMQSLWAITCYFNPEAYVCRRRNYRTFREHLTAPLVTVELSVDGRFELGGSDADLLVQIRGGDVMWQKERLLNIAASKVPRACDRIAWLDCDVVFENEQWAERAGEALDRFAMVHLFDERHNLPRDADAASPQAWQAASPTASVMRKIACGEAGPEDLFDPEAPIRRRTTAGLAWAARREVLERHGLYDACILGTGDRAILCAALGEFDYGVQAVRMNARRAAHYRNWARPFFGTVRGNVGYVRGRVLHLWHGELGDRHYDERHEGLRDFDPFEDIALDASNCWRWSSDKTALHAFVARYFESRREDGAG